jgi:hypothetical protein
MMKDKGLLNWMTGLLMSLPVFSLGVDYERCQLQVLVREISLSANE